MHSGTTDLRFRYADNVGILGFGRTTAESAAAAQKEVDHLLDWAQKNAVQFDTEKSEVIQFPPQYCQIAVDVHVNGTLIEPAEHVRWLGVHLDPRLNFKHHVMTWSGKAIKVAHVMRRFNYTFRGAALGALIRAIKSCVVSIATFGAEVWWPGLTRPTRTGIATPATASLCTMIDKAILIGLRSPLPVLRTTLNAVLHREGEIPPAKIILEGNWIRFSARIKTLDDRHPLRSRAAMCPNVGTRKYKKNPRGFDHVDRQRTRAQRTYRQLPDAEASKPLLPPSYPARSMTKLEVTETSRRWIDNVPASEICAYSDGSSEGNRRSAWGFVLKRYGKTLFKEGGIQHGGEILDAEITGAFKALEAALRIKEAQEQLGDTIWQVNVFLDSKHAVKAFETGISSTSLEEVRQFCMLSVSAVVTVKWIPGHSGIKGNK